MAEELKGARQLFRQLRSLEGVSDAKALRSVAMSASLPILRAAQSNAPTNDRDYLRKTYKGRRVAPGFLKRNIVRRSFAEDGRVRVSIGPTAEAFYGTSFVELGTSKMPAQPWLVPAFDANRGAALGRIKQRIKSLIRKQAKKR